MKDCFAYSFANNGIVTVYTEAGHIPSWYIMHTCSSSFRMIQAWPESFSQLNVKANILSEVCLLYVDCYMHSYEMSCIHMCSLLNIDSYWLYNYTMHADNYIIHKQWSGEFQYNESVAWSCDHRLKNWLVLPLM